MGAHISRHERPELARITAQVERALAAGSADELKEALRALCLERVRNVERANKSRSLQRRRERASYALALSALSARCEAALLPNTLSRTG